MVQGTTRFLKSVNGFATRICFRGEVIQIKLPQRTPIKGESDPQKIDLYPNYDVHNGKIDLESKKPNKVKFNKNGISLMFDSTCISSQNQENSQLSIEELNNLSRHVVQIHYIEIYKDDPSSSWTGTGVLIEHDKSPMIFTCLHTFIPPQEYLTSEPIKSMVLITVDDIDRSSQILDYLKRFDKWKKEGEKGEKSEKSAKAEGLLEYIRDHMKDETIWEVEIDRQFLQFRKQWLIKIQSGGDYTGILDPISKMKPSPAFDISILKTDQKTSKELIAQGNSFYDLDRAMAGNVDIQKNNSIYLFGYNGTTGNVDFTGEEYKKTVTMGEELDIEIQMSAVKSKSKTKIEVPLNKFINPGMSLSAGKCLNSQENLIIYKASMTLGSSGGPLFDINGKLIGISFGNLSDIEGPEPDPITTGDEKLFDIKYPREQIIQGSRNYNLGVSIRHNGLLEYLYPNQDQIKDIESLKESIFETIETQKGIGLEEEKTETISDRKSRKPQTSQGIYNPALHFMKVY